MQSQQQQNFGIAYQRRAWQSTFGCGNCWLPMILKFLSITMTVYRNYNYFTLKHNTISVQFKTRIGISGLLFWVANIISWVLDGFNNLVWSIKLFRNSIDLFKIWVELRLIVNQFSGLYKCRLNTCNINQRRIWYSCLFFPSKSSPVTIQQIKSKTGEYFNLRHFVMVVDRIPWYASQCLIVYVYGFSNTLSAWIKWMIRILFMLLYMSIHWRAETTN